MILPEGWLRTTTADACALVQSGGTPKAGFIDKPGIPFLKVYNIVEQNISFDYRPQFVAESVHKGEVRKSRILPGDVLMNIVGPPLGKVAIVPPTFPEWNANQALTIFRPSPAVISRWLYYFLCGGSSVQSVINETRGSAGQVNISLSQCRNFEISLPPVPSSDVSLRRSIACPPNPNAPAINSITFLALLRSTSRRFWQRRSKENLHGQGGKLAKLPSGVMFRRERLLRTSSQEKTYAARKGRPTKTKRAF